MREKYERKSLKMKNLKENKENQLKSPFDSMFKSKEGNFDKEKIREYLKEIIPEKDYYIIDYIINDKKHFYPNDLTYERGIFRISGYVEFLKVVNGTKEGINVSKYLKEMGLNYGFIIMSHNHINGLIIPSKKDMISMISYKSNYSPIYSPDKTGFLVNNNVVKNQNNWENISNKYNNFIDNKKLEIEKLNPEKTAKIKSNYSETELKDKLENDLYRPYFTNNQKNITKEINIMFKVNNIGLKLYIL